MNYQLAMTLQNNMVAPEQTKVMQKKNINRWQQELIAELIFPGILKLLHFGKLIGTFGWLFGNLLISIPIPLVLCR